MDQYFNLTFSLGCSRIGGLAQYMLGTASKYLVGPNYSIIQ